MIKALQCYLAKNGSFLSASDSAFEMVATYEEITIALEAAALAVKQVYNKSSLHSQMFQYSPLQGGH